MLQDYFKINAYILCMSGKILGNANTLFYTSAQMGILYSKYTGDCTLKVWSTGVWLRIGCGGRILCWFWHTAESYKCKKQDVRLSVQVRTNVVSLVNNIDVIKTTVYMRFQDLFFLF